MSRLQMATFLSRTTDRLRVALEPRARFFATGNVHGIASDSKGRFCATAAPNTVMCFRAERGFGF